MRDIIMLVFVLLLWAMTQGLMAAPCTDAEEWEVCHPNDWGCPTDVEENQCVEYQDFHGDSTDGGYVPLATFMELDRFFYTFFINTGTGDWDSNLHTNMTTGMRKPGVLRGDIFYKVPDARTGLTEEKSYD